jgi:hypothetical protein
MKHLRAGVAGIGGVLLSVGSVAHADPCRAIPDNGSVPVYLAPGKTFSGSVVRVLDGD